MHLQHINSDMLSEPSTGFLTMIILQYIPDRLAFCRSFHTALSRTHRRGSTMALQPGLKQPPLRRGRGAERASTVTVPVYDR